MTTTFIFSICAIAYFLILLIILLIYFGVQSVKKELSEQTNEYPWIDSAVKEILEFEGVEQVHKGYDNEDSMYILIDHKSGVTAFMKENVTHILARYDVLFTFLNENNTPDCFKRYDMCIQYC